MTPARALVVWCPDWPVTAVGLDAATPGVVVSRATVEACTAAARAAGVRRGQRVRDAQRHCPGLVVRDRDSDAEGRLFEPVATAIAKVTPWVEVVRPGVCAIPVQGAARYHGGGSTAGGRAPSGPSGGESTAEEADASGTPTHHTSPKPKSDESTAEETTPPGTPAHHTPPKPKSDESTAEETTPPATPTSPKPRNDESTAEEITPPAAPTHRRPPKPGSGGSEAAAREEDTPARRVSGGSTAGGDEESLRIHVQDTVVEQGFDCGAGIADGLFAAELAARAGEGGVVVPAGEAAAFLAPYPVSVLGRPELADLLIRLGIRTLGAFAALPARYVTGRFGADDVRAHRLARGLDPRPPAPRAPRTDLSVTTEFDPPAVAAEQVVFAAKALAGRLHEALAAEGLTCVRVGVEVTGADGRTRTRLWRHDGALSTLAVAERVRWQVSSWETSPDQEHGGVTLLRLLPDQLVADDGRQEALWGESAVSERVARAAARVQAMLGHQGITRPFPAGGRGPGRLVRVPFGDLPPERAPEGPWPGRIPDPQPAVVHAEPLPATVTGADGAPVTVDVRCAVSAPPYQVEIAGRRLPVTAWTGPWPARERGWDPAGARRRARFQVVTEHGAYLLAFEGGTWHVEAGYA